MNLVDYIILAIVILGALIGFRKGVLNSIVLFVGTLIVIILAFYFKNPISGFLYQYLPFFNLGGKFSGITVFNILIYEGISYFITIALLAIILKIVAKVTGAIDKLLKATIVLNLPSRLLGALCGFLEGYILAFIIIFLLGLTALSTKVNESKYAGYMLENTPVLSTVVSNTYKSVSEIYTICTENKNITNKDEANLESLDVLLNYDILSPKSADKLIETEKLTTPGAKAIIDKYREG